MTTFTAKNSIGQDRKVLINRTDSGMFEPLIFYPICAATCLCGNRGHNYSKDGFFTTESAAKRSAMRTLKSLAQ